MSKKGAKKRQRCDWTAARRRYITTPTLTLDELAAEVGITPSRVRQRAADEGWTTLRKTARAVALDATLEAVAEEQKEFAAAEARASRILVQAAAQHLHDRLTGAEGAPPLKIGPADYCALSRNHRELMASGQTPETSSSGSLTLVQRGSSESPTTESESSSPETLNGSSPTSNGTTNGTLPYTPRNGTS